MKARRRTQPQLRGAPSSSPRTRRPAGRLRRSSDVAPAADATTRERILTAALQVFADRSFDGARTRDIADLAGANLGLIKYYFGDKEALWKAAVTRAFEELQADFAVGAVPDPEADPLEWLEVMIRRFVHFVARRPDFMRLMNDEAKRDGTRMRWLADRFVRPLGDAVRVHVELAQAEGLVPTISPVSLRYIVLGAAGLVFSQAPECRYITGVDPSDPAFAEAHADALIQLLTGRATGAPTRNGTPKARGRRQPAPRSARR